MSEKDVGKRKGSPPNKFFKQKARKSFSIPKKLRTKVPAAKNRSLSQRQLQENGGTKSSSSTSKRSPVDYETSSESDELREFTVSDIEQDENSFTIDTQTSKDVESRSNENEWETNDSIEEMRSSEFETLNEVTFPPIEFREIISELDFTYVAGPTASTPFSSSKVKSLNFSGSLDCIEKAVQTVISIQRNSPQEHKESLIVPDVSYIKDQKENCTLKDANLSFESMSPEKIISFPDIHEDIMSESLHQSEDRHSDQNVVDQTDDQFAEQDFEQNFDPEEDSSLKEFSNNIYLKRKYDDSERSLAEGMKIFKNQVRFTNIQNIKSDTPKKKINQNESIGNKFNRQKCTPFKRNIKENSFDYVNRSDDDTLDIVQNIPKDDQQDDQTQQAVVNLINHSPHVIYLEKRPTIEEDNYYEDINKSDDDSSLGNVSTVQNEEYQMDELDNSLAEPSSHRRKKINEEEEVDYIFDEDILNIPNSNQRKREMGEDHNLLGDIDSYNVGDNLEDNQNFETETPKTTKKVYRNVGIENNYVRKPLRRKILETNSFEDMNTSVDKGSYYNVQNIQNELQGNEMYNKAPETNTYQNKKIKNRVRTDKKRQRDAVRVSNQFKDINTSFSEDRLDYDQNVQNEELQVDEFDNSMLDNVQNVQNVEPQIDDLNCTTTKHQNKRKTKRIRTDGKQQQNTVTKSNSLEDINTSFSADWFDNVQTEDQQADELNNNTNAHQNKRKIKKRIGVEKKPRQNTVRKSNYRRGAKTLLDKTESSIYDYNSEDSFEARDGQIDSYKKKDKLYKRIGVNRYSHRSRSRKSANSSSRKSANSSSSLKVSELVLDNQNEVSKPRWPTCCLTTRNSKSIPILKPVIRTDLPIDSITLAYLDKNSRKKCKHLF